MTYRRRKRHVTSSTSGRLAPTTPLSSTAGPDASSSSDSLANSSKKPLLLPRGRHLHSFELAADTDVGEQTSRVFMEVKERPRPAVEGATASVVQVAACGSRSSTTTSPRSGRWTAPPSSPGAEVHHPLPSLHLQPDRIRGPVHRGRSRVPSD